MKLSWIARKHKNHIVSKFNNHLAYKMDNTQYNIRCKTGTNIRVKSLTSSGRCIWSNNSKLQKDALSYKILIFEKYTNNNLWNYPL